MFDPVTLVIFAVGGVASFLVARYVRRRFLDAPRKQNLAETAPTRQLRRAARRAQTKRD